MVLCSHFQPFMKGSTRVWGTVIITWHFLVSACKGKVCNAFVTINCLLMLWWGVLEVYYLYTFEFNNFVFIQVISNSNAYLVFQTLLKTLKSQSFQSQLFAKMLIIGSPTPKFTSLVAQCCYICQLNKQQS